MRTKALVLTAALTAAGIATSMAQVYSVNAVGYVNQTIPHGYSMVANPFVNATNTLNALLPPASVPPLLTLFKFGAGGYVVSVVDDIDVVWLSNGIPNGDTETIVFGDGVFLLNPAGQFTQTWVGEVAQGTPVSNPLSAGYAIKSSKIPQAGLLQTDLGYPPLPLDTIFKFNTGFQNYDVYVFDDIDLVWLKNGVPEEPSLAIAESAFFLRSAGGTWNRNFTVN
jgi:hypothetical protein